MGIIFFLGVLGIFLLIYLVGIAFLYEFQYTLTKDGLTPEEVTKQKQPYFYFGLALLLIAIILLILGKKNNSFITNYNLRLNLKLEFLEFEQ